VQKVTEPLRQIATTVAPDGACIHYEPSGDGRGLVLVHGGMQSSRNFDRLASALTRSYRVLRYDRRGHGKNAASGIDGGPDRLAHETADLLAVVEATGSSYVFGLSSGAILAMAAALQSTAIEKLILYEPPIALGNVDPGDFGDAFLDALERRRFGDAMAIIVRGVGDQGLLSRLPRPLLAMLFGQLVRSGAPTPTGERLQDLLLTMRADIAMQRAAARVLGPLSRLVVPTLLVGGSRSSWKLSYALDQIEQQLPNAQRALIRCAGHTAADNDGRPEEVARVIDTFLRPSPA
jgi:pimeloyl-ACP methyl ester carboxylesterase